MKIPAAGKCELVYTAEDGTEVRELIHNFKGAGIIQGHHNLNDSIESFARSCFNYALDNPPAFYSENQPTIEGNFWHYVDGVPTLW